jgi:hypothetical protein
MANVDVNGTLEKTYKLLLKNQGRTIDPADLPHSSVFYIREALSNRHGTNYLLEHVQISLWLEGFLPRDCVKRIPDWYIKDYMKGIKPDMKALTEHVGMLYSSRVTSDMSVSWKVSK